jgi:hypothetical protein
MLFCLTTRIASDFKAARLPELPPLWSAKELLHQKSSF